MTPAEMHGDIAVDGRCWMRAALQETVLQRYDAICARDAPGSRHEVIAEHLVELTNLVRASLPNAIPVRVVSFDKSTANNWTLPWHQDRVIAVREKADAPGFTNWSRKAGIWHVEPPSAFLARMVFVRVHLDDTDRANGCMQVALGSHRAGKIAAGDVEAAAMSSVTEDCSAQRGDILLCHALLLHRSGVSASSDARRAVRVDFSADTLPPPLEWAA